MTHSHMRQWKPYFHETNRNSSNRLWKLYSTFCNMEELLHRIDSLQAQMKSPQSIALLRMDELQDGRAGSPSSVLQIMQEVYSRWMKVVESNPPTAVVGRMETRGMVQMLELLKTIATIDPVLNEEVGREGSHVLLAKIMKFHREFAKEADTDKVIEVQDLAAEVAALSRGFPTRVSPFVVEELQARLPLVFRFSLTSSSDADQNDIEVLVNQVNSRQTAQKDVGFVMWPSAVALSRWLVSNRAELSRKSVLELGAGCGLVGLVAAKLQIGEFDSANVILTDFNDLVVDNLQQNIRLNDLTSFVTADGLDFYSQNVNNDGWLDTCGNKKETVDLILASDIICQADDAYAAARSIFCSLRMGGKAIVVCADQEHRFGVEYFEEACVELNLRVTMKDVSGIHDDNPLHREMQKTSGYIHGMKLTMFTVTKLVQ